MDERDLEHNGNDEITSTVKGVASSIPFVGGLVAEVANSLIPNQRIDRIAKYAIMLNERIDSLPQQILDELKKDEDFIDLMTECLVYSTKASTDERRRYIVCLVERGITDQERSINDSRYLLSLLSELNDNEVIWLRYYYTRTIAERSEFARKHPGLLKVSVLPMGASREDRDKQALQRSYWSHLERLKLIEGKLRMDRDSKVPVYNIHTGQPEVDRYSTTYLGEMLLRSIGLIEDQAY